MSQKHLVSERSHRRFLSEEVHIKGIHHAIEVTHKLRIRKTVAHSKTGHTVGLGEGSKNNEVLILIQIIQRIEIIFSCDILPVCFIHDDQDVTAHLGDERFKIRLPEGRTRGIVRIAEVDDLGLLRDGLFHGIQVQHQLLHVRLHHHSTHELRVVLVSGEGMLSHDDFVSAAQHGGRNDLDERIRSSAHKDLLHGSTSHLRQFLSQAEGTGIRIKAHILISFKNRFLHLGTGPHRILIGGHFHHGLDAQFSLHFGYGFPRHISLHALYFFPYFIIHVFPLMKSYTLMIPHADGPIKEILSVSSTEIGQKKERETIMPLFHKIQSYMISCLSSPTMSTSVQSSTWNLSITVDWI